MLYEIRELTTKEIPEASNGYRAIRLGWKDNKKTGKKALSSTKYVHVRDIMSEIPGLEDVLDSKDKLELLTDIIYEHQDTFIHTMVSVMLEENQYTGKLDEAECNLAAMAREDRSDKRGQGKISKEQIGEWFDSIMIDVIGTVLLSLPEYQVTDEMPEEAVIMKANKVTGNYKDLYCKFAGPAFVATVPLAKKLHTMLVQVPDDYKQSRVFRLLDKKLTDMSVEKTVEDFGI